MSNKNRINYIDIIKAIGIILVIIGHINGYNDQLKPFIYSFHMPLFFIAYGMTSKKRNYEDKSFFGLIISKFQSVYLPYIIWALLYVGLSPKNIFYIIYGSHQTLKINNNSSLWFLPCFFISIVLFEIIKFFISKIKLKENKEIIVYLVFSFCFGLFSILIPNTNNYGYPFGFNISFMGLAFIFWGKVIFYIIDKIKFYEIKLIYLFLIFLLLLLGIFTYKLNNVDYVLMAENIYGNVFLFFLTSTIGCLSVIVFSIILDKVLKGKIKELFLFWGQNTLVIFAIQKLVIGMFVKTTNCLNLPFNNIIILFIITVFTLFISNIVINLVNIFIPELNGRK